MLTMKLNAKNWPYKWFGYWKEYGMGYEMYPSIADFVDLNINAGYNKDRLKEYLNNGIIVASTSRRNFPSPFTGERKPGSISWRTDGEWMWLDNISEFIEQNHLIIPDIWYDEILKKKFTIPPNIDDKQLDGLKWGSL